MIMAQPYSITSIHKSNVVDLFADLKVKMQTVWWVKTPLMYSNPTSPISLSFSMLPSSCSSWRSENHLLMCSSDTLSLLSHIQAPAADAKMVLEGDAVHPVPGGWLSVPAVATVIKYSCLCWSFREKSVVEQDIKEREEIIRQRNSEVQVWGILKLKEINCFFFCLFFYWWSWRRHSDACIDR